MPGAMLKRLVKRAAWLAVVSALTLLAVRAFDSQRGPPLESWHTVVPKELTANRPRLRTIPVQVVTTQPRAIRHGTPERTQSTRCRYCPANLATASTT